MSEYSPKLPDIKPQSPISALDARAYEVCSSSFGLEAVARVVGMCPTFIRKVVGKKHQLDIDDVVRLLEQDAYGETFIPRSGVLDYLMSEEHERDKQRPAPFTSKYKLAQGDALDNIRELTPGSINCVVTSTPYWAMRIYKDSLSVNWADGDVCPFGHEQTPEGFVRHSVEILDALFDVLSDDGSIWWNVMDTFNTRTQIRGNAVESLRAMQGKDDKSWGDHECRRYSAGHAYLKDGEQCLIPSEIAKRASRLGYYVKSMITWAKTSTLPEPQESRVSRNLEYIIHLSKVRAPYFDKSAYRSLPATLGGRNNGSETDKLSDVWTLPTTNGRDGHGAQFPVALPGRCIALSTSPGQLVLDPFVGAGNSGVAALALNRRFLGFDVSPEYLATAERRLAAATPTLLNGRTTEISQPSLQENLL